jgi:hypothetical protein
MCICLFAYSSDEQNHEVSPENTKHTNQNKLFLKVLLHICVFVFEPKQSQPKAVISSTRKQIRKYAKEHLGKFFSDGVSCNLFRGFFCAQTTQIRKCANMQMAFPPHLSVE